MMRLNVLLLLAVLASALYLVRTQYDSRLLYTALDRAQSEARRLELEHERLQVDKRAQASPQRVEALAQSRLHMRTATPSITEYVRDAAPLASAGAVPLSPAGALQKDAP